MKTKHWLSMSLFLGFTALILAVYGCGSFSDEKSSGSGNGGVAFQLRWPDGAQPLGRRSTAKIFPIPSVLTVEVTILDSKGGIVLNKDGERLQKAFDVREKKGILEGIPAGKNYVVRIHAFGEHSLVTTETALSGVPVLGFLASVSGVDIANNEVTQLGVVSMASIPIASKQEAVTTLTTVREIANADYFAPEEDTRTGSLEKYNQQNETISNELDTLPEFELASQELSVALAESSSRIKAGENDLNLIKPSDLSNFPVTVNETPHLLDVTYTSGSLNNMNVAWTLKSSSGQSVGSGTYSVAGDNPKQKAAFSLEANVRGYTLTSESLTYDFGNIGINTKSDLDPKARDFDFKISFVNLAASKTTGLGTYTMALVEFTLAGHVTTQVETRSDGTKVETDNMSYLSNFTFVGRLTTPTAELTGSFKMLNETRSVIGREFYIEKQATGLFVMTERKVNLADSVTFNGKYRNLKDNKVISLRVTAALSPNQQILASEYEFEIEKADLSNNTVQFKCIDDSIVTLTGNRPATCLDGAVELSLRLDIGENICYDCEINMDIRETKTYFAKGSVTVDAEAHSYLDKEVEGYKLTAKASREEFTLITVQVGFFAADADLTIKASLITNETDRSLKTVSKFSMVSYNGVAILINDLDPNNQETRQVGRIINQMGQQLGTIEFNQDLGYRAMFPDGSFETLF
ncbi:hypothetical protein WDW89_17040 [Deltaproteobacteria bacterium TL4]